MTDEIKEVKEQLLKILEIFPQHKDYLKVLL